jgi:transposase
MIQITPQMRILLALQPVDFRKGIDGLAAVCRAVLGTDPLGGALFVFRSRRRRALKFLVYDGQGFWLCQKRLSQGRFAWWPEGAQGGSVRVDPHQLQLLLWNGDPSRARAAPMWRAIEPAAGCTLREQSACVPKSPR